jgi:pimeloyl-ACP methyl ester carboxylesterase/DNA-binding CsgD family transcriptional regulator
MASAFRPLLDEPHRPTRAVAGNAVTPPQAEAPPIQYVTTSDGYSIAYTVAGAGPPFIFMPSWTNHAQEVWFGRPILRALTERYRVVNYDARGMGLSTRDLSDRLSLDSYLLDLETVIERVGAQRFVLLGSHTSALVAGHYAARNPERVSALILANSGASWLGNDVPSLWHHLALEAWETFLYVLADVVAPKSPDKSASQFYMERLRDWMTQADYIASIPVWRGAGLVGVLSRITVPTLVLKPRDCPCSPLESAVELARMLPNGRLVVMDGDQPYGVGDDALRAIEDFLAEVVAAETATESTEERPPEGLLIPPAGLSPRQVQVLSLVAQGKTNGEIADELVISLRTVERHVAEIYAKIGARNRVEAAAFAMNRLAKA